MLEAKLPQALTLKQLIEAVKELVTDANFEVDEDGLKLQAMDNSHVALVALLLKTSGFEEFRCDRNMALGVNVASLQKIVKCAGNDDLVTLRAQEDADVLNLVFETKNTDRVAEYEMKLMDIDTEHLGIPDTVYDAEISLPAPEFTRIVRDLKELGESVRIEATKEGVKFSAEGDIGTANVTLKQTTDSGRGVEMNDDEKSEASEDEDDDEEGGEDEDQDEEKEGKPGKEDSDEMDEEKPVMIDSDDEQPKSKKRKSEGKPKANGKKVKKDKSAKKAGASGNKGKSKAKKEEDDAEPRKVSISLQQSVSLTFSIKYLANFTKAAPLAKYVRLHMSNEVPLLVEYDFGFGHVRYYLAPKISDE